MTLSCQRKRLGSTVLHRDSEESHPGRNTRVGFFAVWIIAVMTSSMGKGCVFSAIPIFLFEGSITLIAKLISPLMTETAVSYLSLIGSILIFCVGLNLVWGKKIRVANMLPAVLLAVAAAYIPWEF